MGFTRRDLLKFTGGSAAGLALSPVPWGLLHDTSLLSENWPGIPHPPRGEIRKRYTTCTLCPAGCGVRARCVGDQPVSLAGVAGHPSGALCTAGLAGHHLAFCRDRATESLAAGKPVAMERALSGISAAIAACGSRESVAILDSRPGRAASEVYRRFLAGLPNGIHCTSLDMQDASFGIDLENTRAIVSFGAPVLDGWLSPGRVLANRSHFQLIQVEAAYSRTASLSDLRVPVLSGTESAFAEAVVRALDGDTSDSQAAEVAGMLRSNKPAIAVGVAPAAGRLNSALGAFGRPGGLLPRRGFQAATDIANVPDHSIRVLLIEEGSTSLPWDLLDRKLAPQNHTVVALTPWLDGCARHADYVIAAPVYLESLDEAPTPAGSPVAAFSLSPALLATPPKLTPPAEFIMRLARDSATYPDILKQRVAAIRKDGRGTVFTYADAKSTPIRDIASAEDLWKTMLAGALWLDEPLPDRPVHAMASAKEAEAPTPTPEFPLLLIAADSPPLHASPLMSKLYSESGLRRPANAAIVNPKTGHDHGLSDGCRALVQSATAEFKVQAIFDPAVMPGVIELAMAGPPNAAGTIRRI